MPAGLLKQDSQNFSPLSPSKPLNDLPPAHMYIFTRLKRSFYLLAFHGLEKTPKSVATERHLASEDKSVSNGMQNGALSWLKKNGSDNGDHVPFCLTVLSLRRGQFLCRSSRYI